MQANRSRDTGPELAVRKRLHAMGLRYRVDFRPEPGLRRKADVVFTRARVAVFIDGCFWHGCPVHSTAPVAHAEWWSQKLQRNVERDRDTDQRLREAGWTVLRIWEHEDPDAAAALVADLIRNRLRQVD
ncbi:MAG: very short patch repair endonuclease [Propionicimonas sp.]